MIRTLALLTVSILLFGITFATGQDTSDPLQANSVWANEKNNKMVLTITERKGESFKALFEKREVNGKINGPSIFWLSKDVRALGKSGVGGDNYGILKKDDLGFKIDFTWQNKPTGPKGFFTLRQVVNNNVAASVPNTKKGSPSATPDSSNIRSKQKQVIDDMKPKTISSDIVLEMVAIPAGKFIMGSPKGEKGRSNSIEQMHEVTISKGFLMGKYEVTQKQWLSVMGKNPSGVKDELLPVTDISFNDIQVFLKKINDEKSSHYRLPTEAEWEYACRAGTQTQFYCGDSITSLNENIHSDSVRDIGKATFVGKYKPNPFGLYDMHGNVSEICGDYSRKYTTKAETDPIGLDKNEGVAIRGGNWMTGQDFCRSATRSHTSENGKDGFYGFRLVRNISASDESKNSSFVLKNNSKYSDDKKEVSEKNGSPKDTQNNKSANEVSFNLGKNISLQMIPISSGKFTMGSPPNEKGRNSREEEQREVTISNSFLLGKFEVTQEQWEAVGLKNRSERKSPKFPVSMVSKTDIEEFIKKINNTNGGGFRLPTEAEWEYACRAGTTTAYSFGDTIKLGNANIEDSSNGSVTLREVGSYKPNAFGLYDMHGNIGERCSDIYSKINLDAIFDPQGPPVTNKNIGTNVVRGGNYSSVFGTRSAERWFQDHNRHDHVGFRLAKTISKDNIEPKIIVQNPKIKTEEIAEDKNMNKIAPYSQKIFLEKLIENRKSAISIRDNRKLNPIVQKEETIKNEKQNQDLKINFEDALVGGQIKNWQGKIKVEANRFQILIGDLNDTFTYSEEYKKSMLKEKNERLKQNLPVSKTIAPLLQIFILIDSGLDKDSLGSLKKLSDYDSIEFSIKKFPPVLKEDLAINWQQAKSNQPINITINSKCLESLLPVSK